MGNPMSAVTVRIDEDLRKEAEGILKAYGINLPTAFRMFAAEIVRKRSVPLDLSYQTSPYIGLTGQAYLDFLLEEKKKTDAGDFGTEHELIEV